MLANCILLLLLLLLLLQPVLMPSLLLHALLVLLLLHDDGWNFWRLHEQHVRVRLAPLQRTARAMQSVLMNCFALATC